jgi:hypothetical protein
VPSKDALCCERKDLSFAGSTPLERLRGTSIKTNIKTGGQRVKEGFGIVDRWMIIEKAPDDDRMIGTI